MRRPLVLTAIAASAFVFAAGALAAPLFVITGRGWGHGVGMSQWGAFGLARQGQAYEEILAHYYNGTTIGTVSSRNVEVLLADGRTSLSLGSAAPFKAADGTKTVSFPAGTLTVTKTSTGRIKAGGKTFRNPAKFSPTTAPLRLGSTRYRGTLVVSIVSGGLRAVNKVGLESYVKGVVPRESPDSWGDVGAQAALEAQAVAARSYAVSTGGHCGGGLFCVDTRDQVYGGYDAEAASPNATAAANATAREVVTHQGEVARTYFHSSSGGRTGSSVDVWGGSFSYLTTVADPADLNTSNPHRFWRVLRTGTQLRSQLGLARTPRDGVVTLDGSGRVAEMTMSGPGWVTPVSYGDDELRGRLGVKSTRFSLGVLSITPERTRIGWNRSVNLALLARGVRETRLERRPYGGQWLDMRAVSGSATETVRLRRSTSFRLASPSVTGANVTVWVAPRVNFAVEQPQDGSALVGAVRPKSLAGTEVRVQKRRADGSWRLVAKAIVSPDGSFRATFSVREGTYRAVVTPPAGSGLVRGVSPTLTIEVR
jgi:stage II sporulation protein D